MTMILTDYLAREHAAALEASSRAGRLAREARYARRAERRAVRAARNGPADGSHHRVAAVGHAAARPVSAVRHWLVAGHL